MDNDKVELVQSEQIPDSLIADNNQKEMDQFKEDLKSIDELEAKEVSEVIQTYYDFHSSLNNSQGFSIKQFDWLSALFNDTDIKNNYIQRDNIKKVLINQALYYLTIFYTLYIKRQKDLITKKTSTALPLISNQKKITNIQAMKGQTINSSIKIGIIGCGNIGSTLLKKLIIIKDRNEIAFRLYVSTRQPEIVKQDFLHSLDENIEVCLNNELIFSECDIIFLCIQPHQLDLLAKDVKSSIEDRIDKLNKKKAKVYPLIVSFLSATPLERLRLFFNDNVAIVRTYLDPKQIYLKRIEIPQVGLNAIEKINNLWENKRTYIKESGDHLFQKNKIDMIEKMIGMLIRQFYTSPDREINKEGVTNTIINANISNSINKKKNVFPFEEVPELIFRTIMNKNAFEKFKHQFNIVTMKFDESVDTTEIIDEIAKKYNKLLSTIINFDE